MIKKIKLRNFRNHEDFVLVVNDGLNVLIGNNGVGKTSILEGLFLISTGRSHRTYKNEEVINNGSEFSLVEVLNGLDKLRLVITKDSKRAFVNELEKKKISEFVGKYKVVMFAPEDLELIKGAPSVRRRFLDINICQFISDYFDVLNKYKKVLNERNALLKRLSIDSNFDLLNIFSEELIKLNMEIINKRREFISDLNKGLNEIFNNFTHGKIEIIYKQNIEENKLGDHFFKNQKIDILNQNTTKGIHKDDFFILHNDNDSKLYSSQGIQRIIVISIKLSLLKLLKQKNSEVLLLLDDVLSELDENISKKLLEEVKKTNQVFITSAVPLSFNINANIIKL